jgi:hypothetical protein
MRKLDTASNAEGSVRRESCNQEEVTAFYRTDSGEDQINAPLKYSTVQRQIPNHCKKESAGIAS